MSIKLRERNGYFFIDEPSGQKITASKLELGKTYLHKNLNGYRKIIKYFIGDIGYQNEMGHIKLCSHKSFATACPYEATPEEIEFIDKDRNKRLY